MRAPIAGLHHVTAIASDPQQNLDFYTEVLGLRFVKRTINFDDPGSYHFYFGDDAGSPGTILTFFPWPGAARGVAGTGEVASTALSVPIHSLDFWERRLTTRGVPVKHSGTRFNEQVLSFSDPDGMQLELVGDGDDKGPVHAPRFAAVPAEHSIRSFSGVTLAEQSGEQTAMILGIMGFSKVGQDGQRLRFAAEGNAPGRHIDLVIDPTNKRGRAGAGRVHHIAFRATDKTAQLEWSEEIGKYLSVTPVQDRTYFESIYFREPGGVLFELATDPPGFTLDEPMEALGEALKIPEWYEHNRTSIERTLPRIELHKHAQAEDKPCDN